MCDEITKVLVSGSSGFVGSRVCVKASKYSVFKSTRKVMSSEDCIAVGAITASTDWRRAVENKGVVIHCAARVHVMSNDNLDALGAFREVNTAGTLNLARQAAEAGVKRFIFISSIKVNGESTLAGSKFTSDDDILPEDTYGISKAEAENGLKEIAKEAGMEVVIIRPPLVYGPGVKGNFLYLLKLSKLPIPLPFGLIRNKRSMVYLDNLVDLIITCIDHPRAANRVFLVSDDDDLSLARLLTLIKKAMNRSSWLLPLPSFLFSLLGRLSGKSEVVDRLTGNLQVDSSDAYKYLGWVAPCSVEQGIKATVEDFLKNN